MPKYFIFADVHGYFDVLMRQLKVRGFDINDPDHHIISLGDAFDRGHQPQEVLEFLIDMHNRGRAILIRGNHEDLMEKVLKDRRYNYVDVRNGTIGTLIRLYGNSIILKNSLFSSEGILSDNNTPILSTYFALLQDYHEIGDHIFVHGWIPCDAIRTDTVTYFYKDVDWRKASSFQWNKARWYNGMDAWLQGVKEFDKTIWCGHWHASWGNARDRMAPEWGSEAIFDTYEREGIKALDACTALTQRINVEILEF